MSQHDFNIANQTAPNFRADLNNALAALASLSSGATAPTATFANMLWYDTAANILKMRNEADDGWISVGYLDQGAGAFRILDDTQVTNTSGTQTGLLGDQSTATWEAGTGTTESLVSPAKIKAAIDALVPAPDAVVATVLLGTITTTSGTSQTLSGLDLTDYKTVKMFWNGVSHNYSSDPPLNLASFRLESGQISNAVSTGSAYFMVEIDLGTGLAISYGPDAAHFRLTGYSTATTSINVSVSSGNFDAGSIRVYGIK